MKLSDMLAILTIVQFIQVVGLTLNWRSSKWFSVQHEDYIFIAHLMTWFIVRSIENLKNI